MTFGSGVTAPTEEHLRIWRRMMKRLTGDLAMQARYLRLAIRQEGVEDQDVEHEGDDAAYYAIRAWAAEQILAELKRIPEPELAPDPRKGMRQVEGLPVAAEYHTPHNNDAQWLAQGLTPGVPVVMVGGIPFQRKVCDAGMDGDCYGVGCPQADPATRTNFCILPTGNAWMALRESDS